MFRKFHFLQFCFILFALQAVAQHGQNSSGRNSTTKQDKQLVSKFTLNLAINGKQNCSGSIVKCKDSFYVYTARHCWAFKDGKWGASSENNLDPEREVSYEGKAKVKINLFNDSTSVKIAGDLLEVKLPNSNPIVQQALKENRFLSCTDKKFSSFPDAKIQAFGRPMCLGLDEYAIQCSAQACKRVRLMGKDGKGVQLGERCFENQMGGMSGGPVVVKSNGEYLYLGSVSQHASIVPGSKQPWGPMAFIENKGLWWKRATISTVVDGEVKSHQAP